MCKIFQKKWRFILWTEKSLSLFISFFDFETAEEEKENAFLCVMALKLIEAIKGNNWRSPNDKRPILMSFRQKKRR